jgi:hypothetical protein
MAIAAAHLEMGRGGNSRRIRDHDGCRTRAAGLTIIVGRARRARRDRCDRCRLSFAESGSSASVMMNSSTTHQVKFSGNFWNARARSSWSRLRRSRTPAADHACRGMPFCPCCSRVDLLRRLNLCCWCVGHRRRGQPRLSAALGGQSSSSPRPSSRRWSEGSCCPAALPDPCRRRLHSLVCPGLARPARCVQPAPAGGDNGSLRQRRWG